jgi:hypothetical protein
MGRLLVFLILLAPLALYAVRISRRQFTSVRNRGLLVLAALVGNALLLVGYALALAGLLRLQRACAANCADLDPPPLPPHWEWAMVAYVLASASLYFGLYVIEQRMARREADAVARSDPDAPGLEP